MKKHDWGFTYQIGSICKSCNTHTEPGFYGQEGNQNSECHPDLIKGWIARIRLLYGYVLFRLQMFAMRCGWRSKVLKELDRQEKENASVA